MMTQRFPWMAPVIAILSLAISRADTITFKDGSEITGVIVSESSDQIVIDCFASSASKDLKKIPAGKIAGIKKAREDENAFLELGDLSSPQTLTDVAVYDVLLETTIPGYIAKYPYSRNVQKLRDIATRCELERKRLLAGDRKIDGTWFSSEQIKNDPAKFETSLAALQLKNDPMQLEAAKQFDEMKEKAQKDDCVGALKTYELLERDYPGSRVLPDAVTLAKQQMEVLQQKIGMAKDNFDVFEKRRQLALASAKPEEAKEMKDALENEVVTSKEEIESASKDGTKFFPLFQNSKDAIKSLQDVLISERKRISLLSVGPMRQSLAYTKEARLKLDAGETAGAKSFLSQAQSSWDKNAEIPLLQKMLACLEKEKNPQAQQPTPQPQAH